MTAAGPEDLGDLSRALGGKSGKGRRVKSPAVADKTAITQAYEMKAAEDQAAEMVRVLSKRYSKEEMELWDAETATARYNELVGIPVEAPAATTVAQTAAAPPRVVKAADRVTPPTVVVTPKIPVPDFDIPSTLEAFGKGDPEAKKLIVATLSNLGWKKRPDSAAQLVEALTKKLGPEAFGPAGVTLPSGFGGLQDMLALAVKHPEFASRAALVGAGALVGGVADPLDNPLLSATVGAGIGLAAPSIVNQLERIGAPKDAIAEVATPTANAPATVKEAAHRLFARIPDIQRANYLTSGHGLMANVFAGPWGSAFMGSLEHLLNGDPRGWQAIKSLGPENFRKTFMSSLDEARTAVGRAEGHSFAEARSIGGKLAATPGTWMTAGDMSARKILMSVGFSEEEARLMTLTSSPELPAAKFLGEAGRDESKGGKMSGLIQFLFPFRRTPANIMEQGAMRIPLLGKC